MACPHHFDLLEARLHLIEICTLVTSSASVCFLGSINTWSSIHVECIVSSIMTASPSSSSRNGVPEKVIV